MKRRRSSSSSGSDSPKEPASEPPQSKRTKTTGENTSSASKSQPNISVRLQNADMLSKYRNKNAHIAIGNPKTKSSFKATEISDDDEIWLCEIPNSVDVNKLLGKSLKLGSKNNIIKTSDDTQLECVSSKFDKLGNGVYANTVSVVFQSDDGKLSVKNLKASGQISMHTKIKDEQRETIELEPTVRHECTIFPESLRVRHPLFGNHFEDKVKINKRIAVKLAAATQTTESTSYGDSNGIQIKQEKDDSSSTSGTPKKSSKASKSSDKMNAAKTDKSKIARNGGMDDDLARIKQIFQQC